MNSVKFAGFFTEFAGNAADRADRFSVFAHLMRSAGYRNVMVRWYEGKKLFRASQDAFIAGFTFLGINYWQASFRHFYCPEWADLDAGIESQAAVGTIFLPA